MSANSGTVLQSGVTVKASDFYISDNVDSNSVKFLLPSLSGDIELTLPSSSGTLSTASTPSSISDGTATLGLSGGSLSLTNSTGVDLTSNSGGVTMGTTDGDYSVTTTYNNDPLVGDITFTSARGITLASNQGSSGSGIIKGTRIENSTSFGISSSYSSAGTSTAITFYSGDTTIAQNYLIEATFVCTDTGTGNVAPYYSIIKGYITQSSSGTTTKNGQSELFFGTAAAGVSIDIVTTTTSGQFAIEITSTSGTSPSPTSMSFEGNVVITTTDTGLTIV